MLKKLTKVIRRKKKAKPDPHIFIATPMYGGMCTGFYTQSLLTFQKTLAANNVTTTFSFMFNESLITRARNALVHNFLKTDATHLMFIDADIRFIPDDFLPMLATDLDIICGLYPKKEINWFAVAEAVKSGVKNDDLKWHTGSMVVNLVGGDVTQTVPLNQPVEIKAGGTGYMLIKREVFEKLADKVPTYTNNVMDLAGGLQIEPICEYFATSIDPENNVLLSEDYHFCRVARQHGLKVWAAPWVRLAHLGSYLFEGGLVPSP